MEKIDLVQARKEDVYFKVKRKIISFIQVRHLKKK
jgi:hypothetical protein